MDKAEGSRGEEDILNTPLTKHSKQKTKKLSIPARILPQKREIFNEGKRWSVSLDHPQKICVHSAILNAQEQK